VAILLACGLECGGDNEQAISTGIHWRGSSGGAVATDVVRSGVYSLKCVTAGNSVFRRAPSTNASRHYVGRMYYRRVSGTGMVLFTDQAGSLAQIRINGSGNFEAQVGGGTARSGPVATIGTWFLIDWHLDSSSGTRTLSWMIDGIAQTDATLSLAAADLTEMRIGHAGTSTGTSYFDDFMFGDAAIDYPFGAGLVLGYLPNRDGTHNFTAGDFKDEGGTTILISTTVGYQKIDESAPNTSDYLAKVVGTAGYMEFGFTPSAASASDPRAVTVVTTTFSSSTVSHNQKATLNDGGTTDDVYALRATGGLSLINQGKTYSVSPRTGLPFTKADLDALLVRWGASTDVAPNPRLSRLGLEVEYVGSGIAATDVGGAFFSQIID
jgi:hypothetical protein